MGKYEYAKRLKELFDHECSLRRKEIQTAKTIHEYKKKLKMLKTKIEEERTDLIRTTANVEKRIQKIKTLNDNLRMRLEQKQRRLLELQQERAIKLPQQIEKREHALQEMNNLYCFQSQTQIFFNVRKLPKLIQGLTVSEEENTCKLLPFKIDPQQHTHEEVMEILWEQQRKSGTYTDHWRLVIFGDCVIDNEMHMTTDVKVRVEAEAKHKK